LTESQNKFNSIEEFTNDARVQDEGGEQQQSHGRQFPDEQERSETPPFRVL
jgi:hypothetical protein